MLDTNMIVSIVFFAVVLAVVMECAQIFGKKRDDFKLSVLLALHGLCEHHKEDSPRAILDLVSNHGEKNIALDTVYAVLDEYQLLGYISCRAVIGESRQHRRELLYKMERPGLNFVQDHYARIARAADLADPNGSIEKVHLTCNSDS